jgi:hypothetical protein
MTPSETSAAYHAGRFAQELEEVERIWTIWHSAIVQSRPRQAWAHLPLGWPEGETIDAIAVLPPEPAPDTADFWERCAIHIGQRRAELQTRHQLWIHRDEQTAIH